MYSPQHKACQVEGCKTPTRGKPYCRAHIKDNLKPAVITDAQRSLMRSDCCNALCVDGEQHEYGKQYCAKCKCACFWHPSSVTRAG